MTMIQSRRRFLATLSSAGAAGLVGAPNSFAQEAPPETTTIRLAKSRSLCIAPQYVAGDLLRAEGFTDVRYVMSDAGIGQSKSLATRRDRPHFALLAAAAHPDRCRRKDHDHRRCARRAASNCSRLERIRSIADLKGKTVGVPDLGTSPHVFVSTMAAHVGLDPAKDINWVTSPSDRAHGAFRRRKDRRVARLSARTAGTARPQDRPCGRQQFRRSSLVAVLLLHAGGQPGLHPQAPGRDQARAARHPQGDRLLRQRSERARRGAWSMAASPRSTTMRCRR